FLPARRKPLRQQPGAQVIWACGRADVPCPRHAMPIQRRAKATNGRAGRIRRQVGAHHAVVIVDGRTADRPLDTWLVAFLCTPRAPQGQQEFTHILFDSFRGEHPVTFLMEPVRFSSRTMLACRRYRAPCPTSNGSWCWV